MHVCHLIPDNKLIYHNKNKQVYCKYLTIMNEISNIEIWDIIRYFRIIVAYLENIQHNLLEKIHNSSASKITRIAFLGPKGSFSYLAACNYASRLCKKIVEVSCIKFRDIINKVENQQAEYAILPLENSTSGSINDVYDLLPYTKLSIVNEIILPIDHCILVSTKTDLQKIKTIYSHVQPFQQCSNFINSFPHWNIKYTQSTAAAMQTVSLLNSPQVAALGSEVGGKIYNLQVVARNLANECRNITRFIVLARKPIKVDEHIPAKTTIMIVTKPRQGALLDALLILHQNNLAMSKLESRPIPGNPWEEIFFIDIKHNLNSEDMKQAIKELKLMSSLIKVLGCYPAEMVVTIHKE
ncbi:prephenate dehydratase domain-containing protein [Candidatus Ishikawella capsulata]|nr:prephenate dehydratase domain-containing protein [Candidatus Ishikawaella capsulata]